MGLDDQDDQVRIPAVYMRGGSSKAIFLHERDIPPPGPARDLVLKRLMGTPDPIQVDGMGGAKAVTSKIAILSPSTREGVDVDYTFAQVGVRDDAIDYKLNCGNISAAVGPYAIDEGFVLSFRAGKSWSGDLHTQEVRIFNTGTQKVMVAHVPVNKWGRSVTQGAVEIAAVPGTGAPIMLDYRETVGAGLNSGILPTGRPLDHVQVEDKTVSFTICDVANVYIFAYAADFDVTGHESAADLTGNALLLTRVSELRGKAAQMVGMCQDWTKVDEQSPFIPMVILLAPPPRDKKSHVSGRLFLDNMCHESMAGTGSMAFAACSRIKGSVVFQQVGEKQTSEGFLHIAHPLGIMSVAVETDNTTVSTTPSFRTLSFVRTARRLMDGHVYIPKVLDGQLNGFAMHSTTVTNGVTTRESETYAGPRETITVTRNLANFIANVDPQVLSVDLMDRLKEYLLDYLGVTIAAANDWESTEPIYQGIAALGAAGGSNTVVLKGRKFTTQMAGLLNATFGHSMDFDDTYAEGSLHAGTTAFSAGLAQAESLGSALVDSKRFLLAVLVGYEIICRLGRALGNDAYSRGFHNTGTAGIFGAVATIAVLKRLSTDAIENAFGLAVSKAAGSMQYLENGSWNKRLHPGFAVHDAFVCVALAEAGVVGASKSIEGQFGFLHAFSPKVDPDLASLCAGLGVRWTCLETALKPFPACRMTHGLIEVAGRLGSSCRQRDVQAIMVSLSAANHSVVGTRVPNKIHPDNVVDAQFSAYFQTAHAWLYGSNTGVRCFERLRDPAVHELSEKITCTVDPAVTGMGAKMQIWYADGKDQQLDIPFPLGEPEHPLTTNQVEAKFFDLLSPVFGEARAAEIRDVVRGLEKHSVVELLSLVC
ncbi:hypothetical protein N7474_007982 [Penicillium riverlandense]|uniref:uncharacterized protein n=1 Tax=Penicillium riverlandense TaxID=1903569 RepID=UPI0025478528|nr:uncharacterized protein N7474_007982 [Penicillium riverlandense]KAJ5811681.1 hypothetical protein N7474_007982 [Penicillium riverlandense]